MDSKVAKRYLARVRRALVCGCPDRKALLARCEAMVETFCQENPEAEYDAYVAAFGEPADFAAELLSRLDKGRVEAALKQRRLIHGCIAALFAAIVVCSAVFWYIKYEESADLNDNIDIVEGSVFNVAPGEFDNIMESTPESAREYANSYQRENE